MAVKVDNESLNDLPLAPPARAGVPPKADSQLTPPQFFPQDFFGGSHLAAEFFCALKFLRGDLLIRDDVFDWHGMILPKNPSPVSPEGEKLKPPKQRTLALTKSAPADKIKVTPIPSPSGEGQADMPISPANQGEVLPSLPPLLLTFHALA